MINSKSRISHNVPTSTYRGISEACPSVFRRRIYRGFKESETCVSTFNGDLPCQFQSHDTGTSWQHPYYPAYFFSSDELPTRYLEKREGADKTIYDVVVRSRRASSAVTSYSPKVKDFGGLFTVEFGAMDAWFEEEEQVHVHCKNPYTVGETVMLWTSNIQNRLSVLTSFNRRDMFVSR
jgi:hypothetical protein